MMRTEYTFTSKCSDGDILTSTTTVISWPELADKFYDFLVGAGFQLSKQDLSDTYDQSCFEPVKDNHAEQYGMQPADEREPEDPAYVNDERCADLGNDPVHDVPYGAEGQRGFANRNDRILYEFTVSDTNCMLMSEIFETAKRVAYDQLDFELQSGGDSWPSYAVVMTSCETVDNDVGKGTTDRYYFQVQKL